MKINAWAAWLKARAQGKVFRFIIRVLTILLILLPFYLLLKNIVDNLPQINAALASMNIARVLIALVLLALAFLLLPLGSQSALNMLGYPLRYRVVFQKFFLSQLSKYIPGGFWIVAGRVIAFQGTGVDIVSNNAGMFIEMGMMVVTGVVAFLPYLLLTNNRIHFPIGVYALLAIGMLLMLFPALLNRVITLGLGVVGYRNTTIRFHPRNILQMAIIYLGFWFLTGLGFFFLVSSISAGNAERWLLISSSYSMAWVAGFLAFLTPGGLGVREGALGWILSPLFAYPLASLIAILSRLWWSLVELVLIVAAFLDDRRARSRQVD